MSAHTCIHALMHVHKYMHTHTLIHTCIYPPSCISTYVYIHTTYTWNTHVYKFLHIHSHTHVYTYPCRHAFVPALSWSSLSLDTSRVFLLYTPLFLYVYWKMQHSTSRQCTHCCCVDFLITALWSKCCANVIVFLMKKKEVDKELHVLWFVLGVPAPWSWGKKIAVKLRPAWAT